MRAQFSQTVKDTRVSVKEGTFDNTHVPDNWADLVVVGKGAHVLVFGSCPDLDAYLAQAFHWCPNYDKAMVEFNRILAPNGCAVFIWNLEG